MPQNDPQKYYSQKLPIMIAQDWSMDIEMMKYDRPRLVDRYEDDEIGSRMIAQDWSMDIEKMKYCHFGR